MRACKRFICIIFFLGWRRREGCQEGEVKNPGVGVNLHCIGRLFMFVWVLDRKRELHTLRCFSYSFLNVWAFTWMDLSSEYPIFLFYS
jgi:hypothetical protein